jgi:hypothetical protein
MTAPASACADDGQWQSWTGLQETCRRRVSRGPQGMADGQAGHGELGQSHAPADPTFHPRQDPPAAGHQAAQPRRPRPSRTRARAGMDQGASARGPGPRSVATGSPRGSGGAIMSGPWGRSGRWSVRGPHGHRPSSSPVQSPLAGVRSGARPPPAGHPHAAGGCRAPAPAGQRLAWRTAASPMAWRSSPTSQGCPGGPVSARNVWSCGVAPGGNLVQPRLALREERGLPAHADPPQAQASPVAMARNWRVQQGWHPQAVAWG